MSYCNVPLLKFVGYFQCIVRLCAGVPHNLHAPAFCHRLNQCNIRPGSYEASISSGCREICGILNVEQQGCASACHSHLSLSFIPKENCRNQFCVYPGSILTIRC